MRKLIMIATLVSAAVAATSSAAVANGGGTEVVKRGSCSEAAGRG